MLFLIHAQYAVEFDYYNNKHCVYMYMCVYVYAYDKYGVSHHNLSLYKFILTVLVRGCTICDII